MELNPNLSEKGKHDYALILRATEESDKKAYAEQMERYRDSIFHLCRKMVFNDADDLTIETFGKAFQRLKQYTPAFAFSTWLFKIASNHCIDFIRKKRINALSLELDLPLGTVKAQLYRARDILTSVMESSKKHL